MTGELGLACFHSSGYRLIPDPQSFSVDDLGKFVMSGSLLKVHGV